MIEFKRNTTLVAAFAVIVFGSLLHLSVYYGRSSIDSLGDAALREHATAVGDEKQSLVTDEPNYIESIISSFSAEGLSAPASATPAATSPDSVYEVEDEQAAEQSQAAVPASEDEGIATGVHDPANPIQTDSMPTQTEEQSSAIAEPAETSQSALSDADVGRIEDLREEQQREEEEQKEKEEEKQKEQEEEPHVETEEEKAYREWLDKMVQKETQLHDLTVSMLEAENATINEPIEVSSGGLTSWGSSMEPSGRKVLILSACDNNNDPHMTAMALKNRDEYAAYHGYIHYFYNFTLLEKASNFEHPVWLKLPAIQDALARYPEVEWVWWLDTDAIIMNPEISLAKSFLNPDVLRERLTYGRPVGTGQALYFNDWQFYNGTTFPERGEIDVAEIDMLFTQDDIGLNAGSFFVKRSKWTDTMLDLWGNPLLMWNENHDGRRFLRREQDAILYLYLNHEDVRQHVGLLPQRYFNAYHSGGVSGFQAYYDGDILVHFAGLGTQKSFKKTWKEFWLKRGRVPENLRIPDDSDIEQLVVPEEVEEAERLEQERLEQEQLAQAQAAAMAAAQAQAEEVTDHFQTMEDTTAALQSSAMDMLESLGIAAPPTQQETSQGSSYESASNPPEVGGIDP